MRQTYLIVFESKHSANALREHIKSIKGWAKITDNAWAIVSQKSATQIRDELAAIKDPSDKIFVLRSGTVAAWQNYKSSTSEWFKNYL